MKFPAAVLYGLNAVLALVVSFGFLSPTTAHIITTVAMGVVGLIVACLVRPVHVAVISAAVTSILTGIAGFGLHFTDAQIGAIGTLVSILATIFAHQVLTPNAAAGAAPRVAGR